MADRRHVDAARGDVGRDQDAQLARAQALQDAVAPALRHAAVQRRDRVAELGQAIREPVGVDLRAREDERLLDLALRQDVVEQRVLVGEVVGPVQALLDVGVGVGVRRDVDPLRIAQQVLGEAGDVAEEGGAVHHRLARARHVVGDRRDVVDEAHVEHAIGFVEDEHLDVLEHGLAGLEVVEQAAGRRDQDVERSAQRLELRRIRHAADDGRDAQAGNVAAVHAGRLGDLHRQLARRRQDEDARPVDRALLAALRGVGTRRQDAVQRRQDERRGLAAAGGGGDHQVGAGERRRNGGRLDVGGRGVAGIGDGADEGLGQAEGFEGHGQAHESQRRRLVRGSACLRKRRRIGRGKKARWLEASRHEGPQRRHRRRPCVQSPVCTTLGEAEDVRPRRSEGMNESPRSSLTRSSSQGGRLRQAHDSTPPARFAQARPPAARAGSARGSTRARRSTPGCRRAPCAPAPCESRRAARAASAAPAP